MYLLAHALPLLLSLWLASQPTTWHGGWTANAANGAVTLGGTWDATLSSEPGAATGNWAIVSPTGDTVATGAWSARKGLKTWSGSWQARGSSGRVYTGTWRAQSALPAVERFSELFDAAVSHAVSGTWRTGSAYSGSWSLRTYR